MISAPGLPLCADVCNPADLQGPYGFQLYGDTTISGEAKPVSNLGRMVLAADGGISGYSMTMFAGFLLGNPVTGVYEAHWDCTISWSLQDDSGAFQHFSGVATSDGTTVHYSQTDPGGAQHGTLARISDECKPSDIQNAYAFTLSGTFTPMTPGDPSAPPVDAKGLIKADEHANFKLTRKGSATASATSTDATITVDAQCMVDIGLALPAEDGSAITPMKLRGVLIDGGREILAMETDPGAMVSAALTAP